MKFGKYIAHRGLHNEKLWAPENSTEAFLRAVEKGIAVELDVHLSRDGHVVVFHDENLYRMTGLDRRITDLTLSELKELRLKNTSEAIPLLSEVLRAVSGRVPILIEVKNSTFRIGKLEKKLAEQLENYKGYWAVQAFNPFRLYWFRKNMSKIKRGQLVTHKDSSGGLSDCFFSNLFSNSFWWRHFSKPDFISYDLKYVTMETVLLAVANNCRLFTWTAKTREMLEDAEKLSDSVIFENFIP